VIGKKKTRAHGGVPGNLPLPGVWAKCLWRVPSRFSSWGESWSRRSCF